MGVDIAKTPFAPLHTINDTITTHTKYVSFVEVTQTYEVINRNEFTQNERKAYWYNGEDMRRMKINARSEAKLLESGFLFESDDDSIRGLECRTKHGIRLKKKNRREAYDAVFCEIEYQENENHFDDQAIADIYFSCSNPCQMSAQEIAKQDEIDVKDTLPLWNNLKSDTAFRQFLSKSIGNVSIAESSARAA